MEGEQTKRKGEERERDEKKWRDPRELYLWRRVVMLEDSPGRICMVFNEEGGAQMAKNNKKKKRKKKNIPLLIPR